MFNLLLMLVVLVWVCVDVILLVWIGNYCYVVIGVLVYFGGLLFFEKVVVILFVFFVVVVL